MAVSAGHITPRVGGELPFRLAFSGYSGHLRVEPLPSVMRDTALSSLPDLILPPALPPEIPESIKQSIEREYFVPALDHEEDKVEHCGKYWDFEWFGEGPSFSEPSLPRLAIVPVWEPPFRRGKTQQQSVATSKDCFQNSEDKPSSREIAMWIPKFEEVEVMHYNEAAHNSSSVLRRPGAPEDFVRGSTSNHPFRPGGFAHSLESEKYVPDGAVNGVWLCEVLKGGPLQTIPPGFKQGLDLGAPEPFLRSWREGLDSYCAEKLREESFHEELDLDPIQFDVLFKKAWEQDELLDEASDRAMESEVVKNEKFDKPEESWREADISIFEEILSDVKEGKHLIDIDEQVDKMKNDEVWPVMGGNEAIVEQFSELVPDMALDFPFELDSFQKEAIYHLERSESVFVAAHTSAGKTVVAEYAFALAAKHCTRAVYTSPIKAISNQKYRDFSSRFDVGILTGDVSLRPEASCLIMTTEILRSMLYKGADIIRDIEWVIFDEVHYVNDVERGVIWEEVIIMLPDHVNMVLLSATVPNTYEFADWIGRTKRKKIYVTGTTQRPVPLEHCLYYQGELYNICDHEIFLPQGVKAAKDALNLKNSFKVVSGPGRSSGPSLGRGGSSGHGHGRTSGKGTFNQWSKVSGQGGTASISQYGGLGGWRSETSQWYLLINKLSNKGLLPAVVFCFSKNRCDKSADSLMASDLTTKSEKSEIRVFCDKAFSRLKGSDRHLPQVVRVRDLLHRGIGVHHAGLLPIVKEVVEMLFCRGAIKILFSTETFAMGVNAPARTVAFHSLRKHDGKTFRELLPGEYTQMAGRAGRRGLDKVGTVVIMCWDDIPEEGDLKRLLTGKPTKLESQFRLTYNMILSLLRVEDLKVEDMLKRSFAEFHAQRALPEQQQQLQKGEGELSQMRSYIDCILGEPTIEGYYELVIEAEKLGNQIQAAVMKSRAAQQALSPGRIVVVRSCLLPVPTFGVILRGPASNVKCSIALAINRGLDPSILSSSFHNPNSTTKSGEGYFISRKSNRGLEDEYSVLGRRPRKSSGIINVTLPYFGTAGGTGYVVLEVETKDFVSICKARIQVDTVRLLEDVSTAAYSLTIQQLLQLEKEYSDQEPPYLDPIKDLKLNDLEIVEQYGKQQALLAEIAKNQCHRCPKLLEHYTLAKNHHTLKDKVRQLKFELSDAALQQMPDFQQRIEVLQEVGCIDTDLTVQLKGRVACEINSGDELIATQCLFDNQLVDLDPAEAVALLSALVFQTKEASEPLLTPHLETARERLMMTAIHIGEVQARYGLQINPVDYANDVLKFGLVEVVYEWAKGTPFADICELTNVPEGSIVRTIARLDETCREFKNAARIIGDSTLYQKMDDASNAIKRDIVFAASLYVTGLSST